MPTATPNFSRGTAPIAVQAYMTLRLKANVHPLDIVFRLAEDHRIVLLNGGGFDAPDRSVRVSFANLNDGVYEDIGRAARAVARGYYQAYQAGTGKTGGVAGKTETGTKAKAGVGEKRP